MPRPLPVVRNSNTKCDTDVASMCSKSKTELETIYKNHASRQSLYLSIMAEIKVACLARNIGAVKNFNRLLQNLCKIETGKILRTYYASPENPLRENNIISLACKANCIEILDYLFFKNNKLLALLYTEIGSSTLAENDYGKSVIYYALRTNNVKLLEKVVEKFQNAVTAEFLDDCLSKAYRRLVLVQNFDLDENLKFWVEKRLLEMRFWQGNYSEQRRRKGTLNAINERIAWVAQDVIGLYNSGTDSVVDEEFIYILKVIINNLYILKRELKSTYDCLPWEEMHFCLAIFVKSIFDQSESSFYYRAFLSKAKLVEFLLEFSKNLVWVGKKLSENMLSHRTTNKLGERDKIVQKLCDENRIFRELFEVYAHIRDFYSLGRIKFYVDLVLWQSLEQQFQVKLIERCLQVFGENVKNTLESPKLSAETCNLLALTFPENTKKILSGLRNLLKKRDFSIKIASNEGDSKRFYQEKQQLALIRNDMLKVRNFIACLYCQRKYEVLRKIAVKLVNIETFEDYEKVCAIFNWGKIYFDEETLKEQSHVIANEQESQRKLIAQLSSLIPEKTFYQQEIFEKINHLIEKPQKQQEITLDHYKTCFSLLKMLINTAKEVPKSKILEQVRKHAKRLAPKPTDADELSKLVIDEEVFDLVLLVAKTLDSEILSDEKFRNLMQKIILTSDVRVNSIRSIKELGNRLFPESKMCGKKSKTILPDESFEEKMEMLGEILGEQLLSGTDLNSLKTFVQESKNKAKLAVIEMILLNIMSLNEENLSDNVYFVDTFLPILTGKELRHHLADGNFIVETLPSNVELSIVLHAIEYVKYHRNKMDDVSESKCPSSLTIREIKMVCDEDVSIIKLKEKCFKCVESESYEDFQLHFPSFRRQIEILSRNLEGDTLLHAAVRNPQIKIFEKLSEKVGTNIHRLENLLNFAASVGNCDVLEHLQWYHTQFFNENINKALFLKRTPLHMAVISQNLQTIEFLIAQNDDMLKCEDELYHLPIHLALQLENLEVFLQLLNYETRINHLPRTKGYTLLHIAAEIGNFDVVKILHSKGANIQLANELGWTALHCACLHGHIDIVKYLLENGVEVNVKLARSPSNKISRDYSPLHLAIENSHFQVVQALIEHGADVDAVETALGSTPLHLSIVAGNAEIVEALLEAGASLSKITGAGASSLHLAVSMNLIEIVRLLLKYKVDVNLLDGSFRTPLHYAAWCKDVHIFKILVDAGANMLFEDIKQRNPLEEAICMDNFDTSEFLNLPQVQNVDFAKLLKFAAKTTNFNTFQSLYDKVENLPAADKHDLFLKSCSTGSLKICKLLVEAGADIKKENPIPGLTLAASFGNEKVVDYFLEQGVRASDKILPTFNALYAHLILSTKINLKIVKNLLMIGNFDPNMEIRGQTALNLAIRNGRRDVVHLLLMAEADINGGSEKPIMTAMLCRNFEVVQEFLEMPSICLELPDGGTGMTILHLAAKTADTSIVKQLLEKGCEVDARTSEGYTPLHGACQEGQLSVIELLLESGANINAEAKNGCTAISFAAQEAHLAVLELLIKSGAKFYIEQRDGTPLHYAVKSGNTEAVKLVLSMKGCKVNAKRKEGWSPLHLAAQLGLLEIFKLLVKSGARVNDSNEYGGKAIHVAASKGFLKIVKYLVESEDELSSVAERGTCNQTLLHYASQTQNFDLIEYLVTNGCNVNDCDEFGNVPLHICSKSNTKDMCKHLMQFGAFYDVENIHGKRPVDTAKSENLKLFKSIHALFQCVQEKSFEQVVQLFRENDSIFIDARDSAGLTALNHAILKEEEPFVAFLIDRTPNVNTRDLSGSTPLHHAARKGNFQIVHSLLSAGAIYNITNDDGKKPVDLTHNHDIKHLLRFIDKCFNHVKNNSTRIFNDLKSLKNFESYSHAIIKAKNLDNNVILTAAENVNFIKLQELKETFLGLNKKELLDAEQCLLDDQLDDALLIYQNLIQKYGQVIGYDHESTLELHSKAIPIMYEMGMYREAYDRNEYVYSKYETLVGPKHATTLKTKAYSMFLLHKLGYNDSMLKILDEVGEYQRQKLGSNHEDTLRTLFYTVVILRIAKRREEALIASERILKNWQDYSTSGKLFLLDVHNNIAFARFELKQYDAAIKTFDYVYETRAKILGACHSSTIEALHTKINVFLELKNYRAVILEYQKLQRIQEAKFGRNDLQTLTTRYHIAKAKCELKLYAEAIEMLKEIYPNYVALVGPEDPNADNMKDLYKLCTDTMQNDELAARIEKLALETQSLKLISAHTAQDNLNLKQKLFRAIHDENIKEVQMCLEKDPGLETACDENLRAPLQYAIELGNAFIVNFLLTVKNFDIEQRCTQNKTLLQLAVEMQNYEICESIIKHYQSVEAPKQTLTQFLDNQTIISHKTALHVAAENNCEEICYLLLQNGASYNFTDINGKKPDNVTKSIKIFRLLRIIQDIFTRAKENDDTILNDLKAMERDDFLAVVNAKCCSQSNLFKAVYNSDRQLALNILNLVKEKSMC